MTWRHEDPPRSRGKNMSHLLQEAFSALKADSKKHRSFRNRPENVDLIFCAKANQLFHIRSLWRWKNQLARGLSHLLHHADESVTRHRQNQHLCRYGASDPDTMRNSSG